VKVEREPWFERWRSIGVERGRLRGILNRERWVGGDGSNLLEDCHGGDNTTLSKTRSLIPRGKCAKPGWVMGQKKNDSWGKKTRSGKAGSEA